MVQKKIESTAAIILAAGFGNRLKSIGPKPLLYHHDKSFIEIIFENTQTIGLHPIITVTNRQLHQQLLDLKLATMIVVNPEPELGMLSSLIIGLEELSSNCCGIFLCPVDYPLVLQTTFRKLLIAHRSYPDHIIKPVFQNQSGHPIVLPSNLFIEIRNAPLNQGANYVIRQYFHLTRTVEVDDPGILININTPELYYKYCK